MNNSSVATLGEEDEEDFVYGFYSPMDVPLILLGLLSIIINSTVLYLLFKKEYLRTPKNLFLGSLAVSDLFTASMNIPLFIGCSATLDTPLCVGASVLNHFACLFDILQLLAITLDRLTAVLSPLTYPVIMSTSRATNIIAFISVFSACASFIQLLWLVSPGYDVSEVAMDTIEKYEMAYDIAVFVFFFIPVFVITYAIIHLFVIVRKHSREISKRGSHRRTNHDDKSRWSHEMRSTVILATMLVTYVLFWLLYLIVRVQMHFGNELFALPIAVENFIVFLRFSTCVSNPLLYTLRNHDFKVALKAERDSMNRRKEFKSSTTKSTNSYDRP